MLTGLFAIRKQIKLRYTHQVKMGCWKLIKNNEKVGLKPRPSWRIGPLMIFLQKSFDLRLFLDFSTRFDMFLNSHQPDIQLLISWLIDESALNDHPKRFTQWSRNKWTYLSSHRPLLSISNVWMKKTCHWTIKFLPGPSSFGEEDIEDWKWLKELRLKFFELFLFFYVPVRRVQNYLLDHKGPVVLAGVLDALLDHVGGKLVLRQLQDFSTNSNYDFGLVVLHKLNTLEC